MYPTLEVIDLVSTANNVGYKFFIWSHTASNTFLLGNGGAILIKSPAVCAAASVPFAPRVTVIVFVTLLKKYKS